MLVSDRRRLPVGAFPDLAREAALAGVDQLQVREKDLASASLLALVAAVVAATRGTAARVLVSSRPDVAEAAGAAGVQLPEQGLPVAEVKRSFPALTLGASRHSLEGALRAEAEGADFVLLGPIFATPGKEMRSLGLPLLREAAARLRIPVLAIGGIDRKTAPQALQAGAAGLAAIRAFVDEPMAAAVAALRGR
jgi:thiamine-phosphate diphosphorylase